MIMGQRHWESGLKSGSDEMKSGGFVRILGLLAMVSLVFGGCADEGTQDVFSSDISDEQDIVDMDIDVGSDIESEPDVQEEEDILVLTEDIVPEPDGVEEDVEEEPSPASFGVGVLYTEVTTESDRVLPVTVWYPISEEEEGEPYVYAGLIPGDALLEAPIAEGGPWPLVTFSHGHGGVKEQSVFFTEYVARNGYVVAAPDHVLNTAFDQDESKTAWIARERPLDMRAVIDMFESPSEEDPMWYSTHVDLENIAVSGHSFGGYTSLAVAGAPVSVPDELFALCEEDPEDFNCQLVDLEDPGPYDLSDDRVDIAIPMSPAGYAVFGESGLSELTRPTMIMTGKLDTATPYSSEVLPIFNAIGGIKYLWTLETGDHFTFSNLCTVFALLPDEITESLNANCDPNAALPIEEAHGLIQDMALDFLDYYLKGDEVAGESLFPDVAEEAHEEIEMLFSAGSR